MRPGQLVNRLAGGATAYLVESDVSILQIPSSVCFAILLYAGLTCANTPKEQVDAAHGLDLGLVVLTLLVQVLCFAVQYVHILGAEAGTG